MNKKYEKFINKKNNISISLQSNKYNNSNISNKKKKSTRTLTMRPKNNLDNIKSKNTFTLKFDLYQYKRKSRLKFQQGMFSYKKNISSNYSNSIESNNSIERHNLSVLSNKINNNKNNQAIFPNLKLFLLDNAEISSIKTLTNNSNNFPNYSSMNLNKYKIMNNNNKISKSMDFKNISNPFNNGVNYNYDFLKYNNIIINNINQPNIKLPSDEIHYKPKQELRTTHNLTQFLNKTKEKENEKNSIIFNNFFLYKSKAENESRRMIIEYLKILKNFEKNKSKLNNILKTQNISSKVLNQQKILNTDINIYTMNSNNSKFFYPINSKKIDSPKETSNFKNISKFLKDMNDISTDKIKMTIFLSLPRIMDLIFMNKTYKFIFKLVPNNLSYIKGLESYIYQWSDIKTKKIQGGFDLIKINSCCVNNKKNNNILIETFDGEIYREYELITKSNNEAYEFVKSINYLSRLEKCKVYNKKNFL